MSSSLTQEDFIRKAKAMHGDKYDYSKVEYVNSSTKVCIICPKHGEFWQQAGSHLIGRGCPECSRIRTTERKRMTKEQFVEKAIELHGELYDYSKVEYNGNKIPVCIVCPTHGEFWQKPNVHLSGCKCPKCSNENKVKRVCNSKEWFIERATLVHGDKYDYSKTIFSGVNNPVLITCKKHGDFYQSGGTHLRGSGCPLCAKENKKMTTEEYVRRCAQVHNHKYDYSLVEYRDIQERVTIICPIHGAFEQIANSHLRGQGCPKCKSESHKKPIFGFGINDYKGNIFSREKGLEVFYSVWHSMIRRCYSEYHKKHGPTYKGCSVCEEWRYLSNFKSWFDENYKEGCHLDKDILVQGNKVYSPDTCCFVPQYVNSLLTDHRGARGKYKIGVTKANKGYTACVSRCGKEQYLGTFNTEDEAFTAYVKAKKEVIMETAQKAINEGLIDERIYNALLKYEIKEY